MSWSKPKKCFYHVIDFNFVVLQSVQWSRIEIQYIDTGKCYDWKSISSTSYYEVFLYLRYTQSKNTIPFVCLDLCYGLTVIQIHINLLLTFILKGLGSRSPPGGVTSVLLWSPSTSIISIDFTVLSNPWPHFALIPDILAHCINWLTSVCQASKLWLDLNKLHQKVLIKLPLYVRWVQILVRKII